MLDRVLHSLPTIGRNIVATSKWSLDFSPAISGFAHFLQMETTRTTARRYEHRDFLTRRFGLVRLTKCSMKHHLAAEASRKPFCLANPAHDDPGGHTDRSSGPPMFVQLRGEQDILTQSDGATALRDHSRAGNRKSYCRGPATCIKEFPIRFGTFVNRMSSGLSLMSLGSVH